MFGGIAYPNPQTTSDNKFIPLNETWEWTAADGWSQKHPHTNPTGRYVPQMAYDAALRVVVMFGGATDIGPGLGCGETGPSVICFQDTWAWDGVDWTQLHPAQFPGPWGTMAYDDATNSLLYYNGDTWSWSATNWVRLAQYKDPGPIPTQSLMSYDPATRALVLFGGISLSGGDRTLMWRWDGRSWSALAVHAPRLAPAPQASVARDPKGQVLIGFQANTPNGTGGIFPSQTWQWDGTSWTQLSPTHQPTSGLLQLFTDPIGARLLLVGQDDFQVWAWASGDWTHLT